MPATIFSVTAPFHGVSVRRVRDDAVSIEQKCGHRVNLVRGERSRFRDRHRAVDIVPRDGRIRIIGDAVLLGLRERATIGLAGAAQHQTAEHAVFSVIAPEGAAAILERDASKAPELAERLRLTSADQLALGIVDGVVPEPDPASLRRAVVQALDEARPGDRRRRVDDATARWIR